MHSIYDWGIPIFGGQGVHMQTKRPKTKRPRDIRSQGQNVPSASVRGGGVESRRGFTKYICIK